MSEPLAGKIAFITGGSRGIGRATALKLARAGCDVAIVYHNSHEEAEAVCGEIRALGRRALATQADLCLIDTHTGQRRSVIIDTAPEALWEWLLQLRQQHPEVREVRHLPNAFAMERPYRYG